MDSFSQFLINRTGFNLETEQGKKDFLDKNIFQVKQIMRDNKLKTTDQTMQKIIENLRFEYCQYVVSDSKKGK